MHVQLVAACYMNGATWLLLAVLRPLLEPYRDKRMGRRVIKLPSREERRGDEGRAREMNRRWKRE